MPNVLNTSDICEARVWTTNQEQAAVNSFFFRIVGGGGVTDTDQALVTAIDSVIESAWKSAIGADSVYNGVQLYIVKPRPMPAFVKEISSAGPGTNLGLTMGRQTTGLISWRTALAGSANRGRTYFPFPTTTEDQSGAVPTNAYLTILDGIMLALIGPILFGSAATAILGVYHRATNVTTDILASSSSPVKKWATQKRRGSYGRPNVSPI